MKQSGGNLKLVLRRAFSEADQRAASTEDAKSYLDEPAAVGGRDGISNPVVFVHVRVLSNGSTRAWDLRYLLAGSIVM